MSLTTVRALLLVAVVTGTPAAHGLSTDREQPIEIEADFAELDDSRGVTMYKGNVIVTQGSLRLTGDALTVNYGEGQELENAFLEGRPARFRQRPDSGDQAEGEALQIEYHAKDSLLYLIREARLDQGGKILTGHRISYDTVRSILTARRAPGTAAPGDGATGPTPSRIKVIIPPRKKAE